ncbi:MAG: hypothetical protein CMI85_02845 [Candidatus Pelagibacter sp.]|nr:hypothetical protein [Candidatus Pelagibacter sp.]|tara:strand:- start:11802 stop:12029 length:228 start_codon:yes stop_codon:yes gene_type:complete
MIKKTKRHLKDANKTYFEHQKFAFKASFNCLKSSLTAFIHGICPALFEYDTSSSIKKMYRDMQPIYKFLEDKNKN